MNIGYEYLIKDALLFSPCTEILLWLKNRDVPTELTELFTKHLSAKGVLIGSGWLMKETDLISLNDDIKTSIDQGILLIGNAGNGDFIAIDYSLGNGTSGYVACSEIWNEANIRNIFVPLTSSIGEMLYKMQHDKNFPFDYYSAKKILPAQ